MNGEKLKKKKKGIPAGLRLLEWHSLLTNFMMRNMCDCEVPVPVPGIIYARVGVWDGRRHPQVMYWVILSQTMRGQGVV